MLSRPWLTYGGLFINILQAFLGLGASPSVNAACYSPCCQSNPVAIGDQITMGIALAGDLSLWYNNSDTGSNLLSPCGTDLANVLSGGSVAIFVPQVDQLSLFVLTNSSLLQLSENFQNSASLIAYSQGQGATITSAPRYFMSPTVNLLSIMLVVEFTGGQISSFIWKDDNCLSCGSNSDLCLDNNCGVSSDICNLTTTSFNNSCNFGVNVAFAGTDKNQKSLQSWYQVANTQKFSLSEIYANISSSITKDINAINNAVDGGTPPAFEGQLWS
ncbi:unnamed protein product [Calypogeia fissa]